MPRRLKGGHYDRKNSEVGQAARQISRVVGVLKLSEDFNDPKV